MASEDPEHKSSSSRGVPGACFFIHVFAIARARRRQLKFLGIGYAMIPDAGAWRLWVSCFLFLAFFFLFSLNVFGFLALAWTNGRSEGLSE
jgi:hypothetical protein